MAGAGHVILCCGYGGAFFFIFLRVRGARFFLLRVWWGAGFVFAAGAGALFLLFCCGCGGVCPKNLKSPKSPKQNPKSPKCLNF